MDIEVLKTFQKLAEIKNIPKTADALFVSQSSIINRIRVFEKEIGYKTFYRNGRGLELTAQGSYMFDCINKMLSILNEGVEEVKNVQSSTVKIKFGSVSTAASYLLPDYLRSFHEEHPDIDINVRTAFSTLIIDWVINGKIDLGFINGPLFHRGLKSLHVCSDPIVLIVNTNHRWSKKKNVSPKDLVTENLLPLNRKSRYWASIMDWFDEQDIQPKIGMEFDHLETIKQMVFQNLGIAFVPSTAIGNNDDKEKVKIIPLNPPLDLYRETWLICHKKKPLSDHAKMLWDHIARECKNND